MTDDLDLDAILEGGHTAPLEADAIPDENQSHYCRSCEEPLVGIYCAECGQKNDDYRRPLWRLGKEAIASLTALENRIWRTWAALLFKPGKVAREYANGRREHWSSPVRVYIFTSIFLFGYMELTGTMFFALQGDVEVREGVDKAAEDLTGEDVNYQINTRWFPTQAELREQNDDLDFDLLMSAMRGGGPESHDADEWLPILEAGLDADAYADIAAQWSVIADGEPTMEQLTTFIATVEATKTAVSDKESVESAAGDASRHAQSILKEMVGGQPYLQINNQNVERDSMNDLFGDYLRNPAIGNNVLNKWVPRIIFLMMPLTMLIGAMFIRGRKRKRLFGKRDPDAQPALLYDHLVHATYIHAVAFFVLLLGIIVSRFFPVGAPRGIVALSGLVYMLLYLPISLRRMFRRGWIKTIWTAYGVAFIHFLVVVSLVTTAIAFGVQDQLKLR